MKFKKGTIKNINKKIISGTLAFALVATLSGCSKDFNYTRELKDGEYFVEVAGDIDFNNACNLILLELNIRGKNVLFLSRCYEKKTHENGVEKIIYEYYDVFEDLKIIDLIGETKQVTEEIKNKNVKFIKEQPLGNYLIDDNYKRKSYSVEELKEIMEKIEQNYNFENNKKLIKGK